MSEIELKFGVLPARAGAIDAALRRAGARQATIESRYFDTADRRLAEAGLALRLRKSGGLWEQTIKAPAEGFAERLEETALRPGRWGETGPPVDLSLHDATTAGQRLRAVLGAGDPAPAALEPTHVCRVVRRSIEIDAHGGRVEIAFDRGEIRCGSALAPVCELEYELKGGEPRALIEFGKEAVREQGAWLSTLTKAVGARRLPAAPEFPAAVQGQPRRPDELGTWVLRQRPPRGDRTRPSRRQPFSGHAPNASATDRSVGVTPQTMIAMSTLKWLRSGPDSRPPAGKDGDLGRAALRGPGTGRGRLEPPGPPQ